MVDKFWEWARSKVPFEKHPHEAIPELTDTEILMLGVRYLILETARLRAYNAPPEQRYDPTMAKLVEDLYVRAMRRF